MTTSANTIAYHRERSRHFLALVDDELARGELEEASNKVWGAAAHAIKAVAERRGWEHHAHALIESTVLRLVREEGAPSHIEGQYYIASHYHQRFYGGPPDADSIRYGKSVVAEFIATLESLG
ncbi:MAG: hypothetical protein OXU28_19280 [Chloroflexota bacterium]|nr:hypothetical protein [Chloroflexota bacterium]